MALENADTIKAAAVREHRDMAPIEEAAFEFSGRSSHARRPGPPGAARTRKGAGEKTHLLRRRAVFVLRGSCGSSAVVPVPGIAPYEADARLKANAADTEQRRKIDAEVSELRAAKYGAEFVASRVNR